MDGLDGTCRRIKVASAPEGRRHCRIFSDLARLEEGVYMEMTIHALNEMKSQLKYRDDV